VDLFPTLVNLGGGQLPNITMDGVDMAPILFESGKVCFLLISCYIEYTTQRNTMILHLLFKSNRDFVIYYPANPNPDRGVYAVRWNEYKAHYYSNG